ncbi:MAG: hypothetical protein M3441_04210 [Chloroflexota bacterium]|nr:hypothetical protein [Chloroflexota bacterium]
MSSPTSASRTPQEEPEDDTTLALWEATEKMLGLDITPEEYERAGQAEEEDTLRMVEELALARQRKEEEDEKKKKGSRRRLKFWR